MEVITDTVHHWQQKYEWALSQSDPRVADWFLMDSYAPTLVLTALYVLIVRVGPHLMKNREPFNFPLLLFFYNMFLVAVNLHIFVQLVIGVYEAGYSWSCQPVQYSYDPAELRIAKALWWFYFSKVLEFMDTFFFVLRKKNNQISFLHVYHHATMFPIWWIGIKWVAGGQSFFGAMINSFIHVLMYSYYGVSALGPHMQKYLWWKRYLTRMQLLQFFMCLIKVTQSILTGCDFPMWMQYTSVFYGCSLVVLFSNFYYQAYIKARSDRAARKLQFFVAMLKVLQSLYTGCDFPLWMQWVSVIYGVTIITLFANFYYQAYVSKSRSIRNSKPAAQVQFVVGGSHAVQSLYFDCNFPKWMQWALVVYAGTILSLFLNFYFHAYVKARSSKAKTNGHTTNGHISNGTANGEVENKKSK